MASSLQELAAGQWQPVLNDTQAQQQPASVRRLLLCTGAQVAASPRTIQPYVQQHRPLEQPAAIPSSTGTRREERQQMSRRRRTIARHLVDSRESVQFLARGKELIEDPEALLLEG